MSFKKPKIAIIGATGLVGKELLKLLQAYKVQCFASKKRTLLIQKKKIPIYPIEQSLTTPFDLIFFCVDAKTSEKWIPKFSKNSFIIDSSSHFRQKKEIPLVIPEINGHLLSKKNLIASPNCTTTLMLLPLYPLHKKYKIKRIVASTYQAASGGGIKLMEKLKRDTLNHFKGKNTSYGFNLFLHESSLNKQKYSQEEEKIREETKKILDDTTIKISATCVRVPIFRAHSISLNVEFQKKPSLKKVYELLKETKNVKILEDYKKNKFATPKDAAEKKEVFCSRIRLDKSQKNTLELWVVGDQLLKGAAYNLFQIADWKFKL